MGHLDRDREASHDLNRLLDKPGSSRNGIDSLKISFLTPPGAKDVGVTKPGSTDDSGRHCNGPVPKERILDGQTSSSLLF